MSSSRSSFACGLAGALASNPVDVVRTRMMNQKGVALYQGTLDCILQVSHLRPYSCSDWVCRWLNWRSTKQISQMKISLLVRQCCSACCVMSSVALEGAFKVWENNSWKRAVLGRVGLTKRYYWLNSGKCRMQCFEAWPRQGTKSHNISKLLLQFWSSFQSVFFYWSLCLYGHAVIHCWSTTFYYYRYSF